MNDVRAFLAEIVGPLRSIADVVEDATGHFLVSERSRTCGGTMIAWLPDRRERTVVLCDSTGEPALAAGNGWCAGAVKASFPGRSDPATLFVAGRLPVEMVPIIARMIAARGCRYVECEDDRTGALIAAASGAKPHVFLCDDPGVTIVKRIARSPCPLVVAPPVEHARGETGAFGTDAVRRLMRVVGEWGFPIPTMYPWQTTAIACVLAGRWQPPLLGNLPVATRRRLLRILSESCARHARGSFRIEVAGSVWTVHRLVSGLEEIAVAIRGSRRIERRTTAHLDEHETERIARAADADAVVLRHHARIVDAAISPVALPRLYGSLVGVLECGKFTDDFPFVAEGAAAIAAREPRRLGPALIVDFVPGHAAARHIPPNVAPWTP